MSEREWTPGPWTVGWGDGLTGPTTPSIGGATCGGKQWETVPVSKGVDTIAIVPAQCEGKFCNIQVEGSADANAHLIAAAPDLYDIAEMAVALGVAGQQPDRKTLEAWGDALAKAQGETVSGEKA